MRIQGQRAHDLKIDNHLNRPAGAAALIDDDDGVLPAIETIVDRLDVKVVIGK